MKKSWFNRLILSYLPMFTIVVTFIFFVFFQIINEQGRKNAIQANDMLSLQSMRIVDTALKTIDNMLLLEIANSEPLINFFTSDDTNHYYAQIDASKKLKGLIAHYPLIDSIYMVKFKEQYILSNATSSSIDQFLDKDFIEQQQHAANLKWTNVRSFQQFSMIEQKDVISLTRNIPFLANDEGIIVLNVAVTSLQRLIIDLYDPSINYIQIKDRVETPLFPLDNQQTTKGITASYTSAYSDLTFISGFVNEQFVQNIFWLYNIWFIVGFIIIIIGLVWVIYISRKNAKPVEQIVARISGYMIPTPSAGMRITDEEMNEFTFIESAFTKLSEQSQQFERQYNEDLHLRTRHLFQQLIDNEDRITLEQWQQEASRLQLPNPLQNIVMFIVEIDKYGEFCNQYSRDDQNLLKFVVRSIADEVAVQYHCECWAEWSSPARLSGLLFYQQKQTDPSFASLCDSIRRWIELNTKFTVTVTLGQVGLLQSELAMEHKRLAESLDYKIVLGENRLILRDDIQNQAQIEIYSHLGMIRTAATEFKRNNKKWQASIQALFSQLKQGLLTNHEMKNMISYLLFSFGRELASMGSEHQMLWEEEVLPVISEILETVYSIEEVQTAIISELKIAEDKLASLRYAGQFVDVVKEMMEFIEQHYADPNMSLDYLSDKFDINAKYISKLFKDTTGEKFIDFLIGIRMKEAKRLLASTEKTVQDIASDVGYMSVVSFTRAFKKVEGVSPGEYRNDAKTRGIER